MTRRASPLLFLLLVACGRDVAPGYSPPPIVSRAVVTGRVVAPNGFGVANQLVYAYSDFTGTCGPTPTLLGLMRTNASGSYLFDRVVAPDERDGACITVVVRPETSTGYASAQVQGLVSFRLLPPIDTLRMGDLAVAP